MHRRILSLAVASSLMRVNTNYTRIQGKPHFEFNNENPLVIAIISFSHELPRAYISHPLYIK